MKTMAACKLLFVPRGLSTPTVGLGFDQGWVQVDRPYKVVTEPGTPEVGLEELERGVVFVNCHHPRQTISGGLVCYVVLKESPLLHALAYLGLQSG